MLPKYVLLSRNLRCGLIEEEHFGFIEQYTEERILKIGENNNYFFNMRSCMKPLQLAAVSEIFKEFNLTDKEIAVSCGSHAGEKIHTELVSSILKKGLIPEENLLCPGQEPLSKKSRIKLIKQGKKPTAIHNNCSGKHSAILLYCKLKNIPFDNYNFIEHPAQKKILNFVADICEISLKDCKIVQDGCTLPVLAMPIKNIAKGYKNLFCNKDFEKIKSAIINNPYIYGGIGRLDSELVFSGKGRIIAKVGAGNICCVFDLQTKTTTIIKISDSDNFARAIILIEFLKRQKFFSNKEILRLNKVFSPIITDEKGTVLGKTEFSF